MPYINTPGKRRGSCCIQGTGMDRSHEGIGPGGLNESLNTIVFSLAATVVLSSLNGKTFQTYFFVCLVWQTKFFIT